MKVLIGGLGDDLYYLFVGGCFGLGQVLVEWQAALGPPLVEVRIVSVVWIGHDESWLKARPDGSGYASGFRIQFVLLVRP